MMSLIGKVARGWSEVPLDDPLESDGDSPEVSASPPLGILI
jgi:hypothetical protein